MLDQGGKACRTEKGLGSGISHTLGRLVTLIGLRTTSMKVLDLYTEEKNEHRSYGTCGEHRHEAASLKTGVPLRIPQQPIMVRNRSTRTPPPTEASPSNLEDFPHASYYLPTRGLDAMNRLDSHQMPS